jgi:hypothetical protein
VEDDGLVVRFIPTFVNFSPVDTASFSQAKVNQIVFNLITFRMHLNDIFRKSLKLSYPQYISMDREADRLFQQFRQDNLGLNKNPYNSVPKNLMPFFSKLHGVACRIAGILTVMLSNFKDKLVIIGETAQLAIEIARTISWHANYAFDPDEFPCVHVASDILKWIKGGQYSFFTLRHLERTRSLPDKKLVHNALTLLQRRNCIGKIKGPKQADFYVTHPSIVNPDCLPDEIKFHPSMNLNQSMLPHPLNVNQYPAVINPQPANPYPAVNYQQPYVNQFPYGQVPQQIGCQNPSVQLPQQNVIQNPAGNYQQKNANQNPATSQDKEVRVLVEAFKQQNKKNSHPKTDKDFT